ncbi:MAG: hypothetical protein WA446_13380, partial [Steroidobacteraceae bacterium]
MLEILPIYDALARLKHQDHRQSDAIAGWALGTATGYWPANRETPVMVQILPRGLTIGFARHFFTCQCAAGADGPAAPGCAAASGGAAACGCV